MVANEKPNSPLYITDKGVLCYSNFVNALTRVGINEGDIIYVTSDISTFGKLAITQREVLLHSLNNALKECVGQTGTIIMPTFTYSFCNNEVFDFQNSKSTVGVLTEFFRKQPDVIRTMHPIFSAAIWGKRKNELYNIGQDSFGAESIFDKLYLMKGKHVFFGAPFRSCTYMHYIEQQHGIPYRYLKSFKGQKRIGNVLINDECTFFVRYMDRNVVFDSGKFEQYLLDKGLLKYVTIGNGRILMIEAETMYREGMKKLDQDIYFFLKEEPNEMPIL